MNDEPLPGRHLDLEGAYNIRDIGGYQTADGQSTRWKTFLRSDSLHRLPAASQAALIDYGLRTVVDLRRSDELEQTPNVFADSSQVAYHHHNIVGDEQMSELGVVMDSVLPADRIVASYSKWLDRRQPQFRDVLTTLAVSEARPALYHCAGGKDRTGVISALLLGIAGVSAETISEDYALTARYVVARWLNEFAPPEVSAAEYTWQEYQREFCPQDAMLRVLQHLDERYGGVESYVRTIGLSEEQVDSIRSALVE